jgi:hypothetical protein
MSALEHGLAPEEGEDAFEEEREAFRRLESGLRSQYEGQYIAVREGRVVGHGTDDEDLAVRMHEAWGDLPFFIGRVGRDTPVYEIPSPEGVR